MLSSMLAIPPPRSESGSISDSGSLSGHEPSLAPARFPHTRAQLSAIARQYKPDSYDSDFEGDDFSRTSPSFVARVVSLLDQEREDELKSLLKDKYGDIDAETLEQHVLDLMHKHRDDSAGVPFLFLTPTRRPISRPSSRASSHSVRLIPNRPDTPNSAPSSPLAYVFRRPHTPATSPLGVGQIQTSSSYMSGPGGESTASSPTAYSVPHSHSQYATSLPSSPLSSPRLLNAKAHEFKPYPRPLSAASSNPGTLAGLRALTPSPDLWAHSSSRATSNLAIAAPLIPDQSLLSRSNTPSSSLRASISPGEEDEDDPFDPFSTKGIRRSFHSPSSASFEPSWLASSSSSSSFSPDAGAERITASFGSQTSQDSNAGANCADTDANDLLTDGMTPFDVLSSVFGTTLAPSELEEALAANGYDFERAMAWLVDRTGSAQYHGPPVQHAKQQNLGGRVSLVSRDGHSATGLVRGGRTGYQPVDVGHARNSKFVSGRPVAGGNRVCRYFLAGECLRADCRFSHDLERALCRFWLRGTCAKQENCEFLHHLPQDVDVPGLTAAMSRADLMNSQPSLDASPPLDDFPTLDHSNPIDDQGRRGGYQARTYHDPGRTRFATAVKKPPPSTAFQTRDHATLAARREAMGSAADSLHHRTAIVAPKPSPRLKLRPATLLPTLPTGESVNSLYMAYRSRALQLGAARNACLSRAADAWRRGDGAAAKRFSREGHDLNTKMATEMAEAAAKLVQERARLTEQAVKLRDSSWSDDPGDRTSKGQSCGGGFGVVLGVARMDLVGENGKLSPEERTESILDLHGLHSNEASEVLEEFLLALEREHFYGLAYLVVGEEKHTGTQDTKRGASRERLAAGVREWLHRWGYPWSERDGVICVDPLTHL